MQGFTVYAAYDILPHFDKKKPFHGGKDLRESNIHIYTHLLLFVSAGIYLSSQCASHVKKRGLDLLCLDLKNIQNDWLPKNKPSYPVFFKRPIILWPKPVSLWWYSEKHSVSGLSTSSSETN